MRVETQQSGSTSSFRSSSVRAAFTLASAVVCPPTAAHPTGSDSAPNSRQHGSRCGAAVRPGSLALTPGARSPTPWSDHRMLVQGVDLGQQLCATGHLGRRRRPGARPQQIVEPQRLPHLHALLRPVMTSSAGRSRRHRSSRSVTTSLSETAPLSTPHLAGRRVRDRGCRRMLVGFADHHASTNHSRRVAVLPARSHG